jgi:hypothetical protein
MSVIILIWVPGLESEPIKGDAWRGLRWEGDRETNHYKNVDFLSPEAPTMEHLLFRTLSRTL